MNRRRCHRFSRFRVCALMLAFAVIPVASAPAADLSADALAKADTDMSEAQAEAETGKPGLTGGLPLPRFVSVNVARANMRKGPGRQYPIAWVLVRRNLPVEVIEEYDNWRRVRERSGEIGWVHKAMLSGRRTAMITAESKTDELVPLYGATSQDTPPVLRAEAGAIGEVRECSGEWCALGFKQGNGWVRRDRLWGVYPDEKIE